jgi:hypothetical protein
MATSKEIKEHLEIALKEVGKIKPWFDDEVNEWIFSHPSYPVEYGGETAEEVIQNYPKYLREFVKQRLNDNLDRLTEKQTKGHGGKRSGAGRPKGSVKEEKERISLPKDITSWFRAHPQAIEMIRKTIQRHRAA